VLSGKGIVTDFQKDILRIFSSLPDSGFFYLTGGTALIEFYTGHRKSFDLDLFTSEKPILVPFSRILEESLRKKCSVTVVRRFETFVEMEAGRERENIRIHLAYDSPFRLRKSLETDLGVPVSDFEDLAADKLLAFYGRTEPRDAIDVFFILKMKDFRELAELAQKKDPGFDLYWLAVALEKTGTFPDEIDKWPVEMIVPVDIKNLKGQFVKLARQIMTQIKTKRPAE